MKVLKFEASWCGPCKMLSKTLDKITTDKEIEVCDIDEHPELASQYGVRGVPTMVMLDDAGKEVSRLVGNKSEREVSSWLSV